MSIQPTPTAHWSRGATAQILVAFTAAQAKGTSQRAFAEAAGVPRTTLQGWLERQERLTASPALVAFLESPAGLELLHRLVWALVFVLCFVVGCGARPVAEVLRLAGLERFVACSHGYLWGLERQMADAIGAFDRQETAQLARQMKARLDAHAQPARPITACLDEHFHEGRPCLVAIEPVANFILREVHVPTRDAAAWEGAMAPVLAALPVKVVQATSDEGKAVLAYTASLAAAHSPDVFHVQRELSRTLSAPFQRLVARALELQAKAHAATEALKQEATTYAAARQGPGRPRDYAGRIAQAEAAEQAATSAVEAALSRQQQAREARRGLSAAYHLVDLQAGRLRTPDEVMADLAAHLDTLSALATDAGLPGYSHDGIAKARRVLPAMCQTLRFVHQQLADQIAAAELTKPAAALIASRLLPAAYLARVAQRLRTAEARRAARDLAARLQADAGPLLAVLDADQGDLLQRIANDVADLFQRASSCVEGRNGQLALRHHSLHHLSPARLAALTAVHNFYRRRPDGTTAAQRFFGTPHAELFDFLLAHLACPARPGGSRHHDQLVS